MSDLRGAIRDLRNVAKRLDAATFNPDMNALKNFVDKLDKKGTEYKPSEDDRAKALDKFLRGDYDFTRRELRSLPFIIHEREITLDDAKNIFDLLDLANKRHLSGLVNVYLNQYDNSAKTELLRRRLSLIPKDFTNSTRLRKIFAARDKLFADNRMANMARLLAQKLSVDDVLETIGLSNFYKASRYIQMSLAVFFRYSPAPLADRFKLLDELDLEFDTYKNIFPYVADALIQAVDRAGVGKRKCMDIFYRRLGDPRFGDRRFSWDNNVSSDSQKIFCSWIAEADLRIFFEVIREALNQALKSAKNQAEHEKALANINMWNAREDFWRNYLPYIGITWVVLGSNAKKIAYRLENKRKHGELLGKFDKDQCGLLFQIENYILAEWSHNGALRVYHSQNVTTFIGHSFTKTKLMDVEVENKWIHRGSWQKEVSEWLRDNCKIDKTIDDWRL